MSGWRKRQIAQLIEALVNDDVPALLAVVTKLKNKHRKNMNRQELEKLRNNGPCVCGAPDCNYCALIGDFKFQWFIARTECGILRNQLERAIEIGGALAARTKRTEDADDWCYMLDKLLAEVETRHFKPEDEEPNNASEI